MNNGEAKFLVKKELGNLKYYFDKENSVGDVLMFVASTSYFSLLSMPLMERYPIITYAGVLTLTTAAMKLIDYSHHYTKQSKLEMARTHAERKVLKLYRRQLSIGKNPLEYVPFDEKGFKDKLSEDADKKIKVYKK